MASKLKIAVITLSTAFAAVAIPSAGFMVEAGLEAKKISAEQLAETAKVIAEHEGQSTQEDLVELTNNYQICLHQQSIPAMAVATTLTKWADRVSFVPPVSNAMRDVAAQEALASIEEMFACVESTLETKQRKKPTLII